MILLLVLFIIGILLLLKCADLFVDGASGLAKRFGISAAVIGFTVVAFGTSLPELVVSAGASLSGSSNLALGNVIGSNVVNIAFILALCSVLMPQLWSLTERKRQSQGLVLMFVATAVFLFIAWDGMISRFDGIILLCAFAAALFIIWRSAKQKDEGDEIEELTAPVTGYRDIWMTLFGLVGVIIGAHLVVSSSEEIALLLGVSEFIIAVTIVAIGTSLPELVTSIVAIMKGEFAISAGNILGSNLFNILMILGVSSLILPLTIPNLNDLVLLALFTLAVLPFLTGREIITRLWGVVLMIGYIFYVLYYAGMIAL